jgi:hypothetical protein
MSTEVFWKDTPFILVNGDVSQNISASILSVVILGINNQSGGNMPYPMRLESPFFIKCVLFIYLFIYNELPLNRRD